MHVHVYGIKILTNSDSWFVDPFEIGCFFHEATVGFAFLGCKMINFEHMQEVTFGSVFAIVTDSDMVGTDHGLLFFVLWIRDEDVIGYWWLPSTGKLDQAFQLHLVAFLLGHLGVVRGPKVVFLGLIVVLWGHKLCWCNVEVSTRWWRWFDWCDVLLRAVGEAMVWCQ
jgi:hypothetical protein